MKLKWFYQIVLLSGAVCCAGVEKGAEKTVSPEKSQPVVRTISFTGKDAFDPEKKRQDVVDLIDKGQCFLAKNSFVEFVRRINTNGF